MNDNRSLPVRRQQPYPEVEHSIVGPSSANAYENEGVPLKDYWRVLVARRWTIIAAVVTIMAVTVVWTLKQTPVYKATAAVQIDRENPKVLDFGAVYNVETTSDDSLRTQFEVLKSRRLATNVILALKLDQSREFQPRPPSLWNSYKKALLGLWSSEETADAENSDRLRGLVTDYISRLKIVPRRQARIVDITFEAEDPALAARIVNAHADHYIKQNLRFKWEATQQATEFLSDQLVSLKANLEKSQDSLQEYSVKNEILFTSEGRNTAEEKLRQLQEALTGARNDRFRKQSLYDQLPPGAFGKDGSIEPDALAALPPVMTNSLIATLTSEMATLKQEESALAVSHGPRSEELQRVQRRIEQGEKAAELEKRKIVATIKSEFEIAQRNEEFLTQDVVRQTEVVNRINQQLTQYDIMKQEAKTTEEVYQGLLNRSQEAAISAGLNASNVRIVDPAEVPPSPIRPRKAMNLMLSFVVGLLTGVGLAFAREYMDDTFKSADDVLRSLKAPVLGVVPKLGTLAGRYGYGYRQVKDGDTQVLPTTGKIDLATHDTPTSVLAEAYRSIRTSLLLSAPDSPPKVILVTSAVPSEGKTVTAINTAISLTQAGSRVVLIDADMRKPRIHAALSLDAAVGLSSFLSGGAALREVIYECQVPNLFVVPCGIIPPNPSELTLSNSFRRLLETLREYFDYVIIDTPPLNSVSDARILATICDGVMVVIKSGATSRSQVRHALEHLSEPTRVVGVVLNDLDVRNNSHYASHYYYAGAYK
jgi:succinoglycan biosynthesis transport protein ExoP